jgi:hypothetical protein
VCARGSGGRAAMELAGTESRRGCDLWSDCARVHDEHEEAEALSTRGTASWPGLHARRPVQGCVRRRVARPAAWPLRPSCARGTAALRAEHPKAGSGPPRSLLGIRTPELRP